MKQAYISTAFWDDDWVGTLDPSEKLFYLYLITNSNNNIVGLYKLPKRKLCFDTGFSIETTNMLLSRFENDYHKIIYIDDHVFLKNMVKNQALNSPKLILGMTSLVRSLCDKFKVLFLLEMKNQGILSIFQNVQVPENYDFNTLSIRYGCPMDTLSIQYANGIDTLPYNLNINQNRNQNIKRNHQSKEKDVTDAQTENDEVMRGDEFLEECHPQDESAETANMSAEYAQAIVKYNMLKLKYPFFHEMESEGFTPEKIIQVLGTWGVQKVYQFWAVAQERAKTNKVGYFYAYMNNLPEFIEIKDKNRMKYIADKLETDKSFNNIPPFKNLLLNRDTR